MSGLSDVVIHVISEIHYYRTVSKPTFMLKIISCDIYILHSDPSVLFINENPRLGLVRFVPILQSSVLFYIETAAQIKEKPSFSCE